jgi:3-methylfumaryl-CoA hydratase
MSDWRDWIGKSKTLEAQLDADQANHMAVTLDQDPGFQAGDALPPAWHWLYFHDLVKASDLGSEGHPKLGIVMPPVMLPRRMWAGGSFTFHSPLRLGDTVRKTSKIRSIEPKKGQSGLLCIVTVEHTLSTGNTINLLETQTIVYREMSNVAGVARPAAAPLDAEITRRYTLDSTALFRYSALTFNGHRIHYDADYCREVEGYPNLVIHGPLIATLLLDLYIRMGKPLHTFSYRAKNPLFLPHPFSVNARSDVNSTRLWASNHEGGLAMEAEAAAG